jgi:bifunctional UDP-N-acetylglucosamine pyrophosphorylase/glucosamine-1-phosphate N-acetyltransferase
MDDVSVIILAAGYGTRMRSKLAKVLHRAGGAPLIEHVIRAAMEIAPPERITAVVGHQGEKVRDAMAHLGVHFQTQEEQHGTGHAVLVCRGLPRHRTGRVVVMYGDCPLLRGETLQALVARHEEVGVAAATLVTCTMDDPRGYGRIFREDGFVARIVEEKAATEEEKAVRELNSGIYCFEAKSLWPHLEAIKPNPASGEIYLTDMVEALRQSGLKTAPFVVADPAETVGINNRVELAEVDGMLRTRKAKALMTAGVTIERPETVSIDSWVEVGQDTVIECGVQLRGRTVVGADCRIGSNSILDDALIEDGSVVHPVCVILGSTVGTGCEVGPFARMRMGAVAAPGAQIGNFVELKKTRLGPGSKAMHLAYLGDSTIGENVNIGAGTITCNYDGRKKHPTLIGDGAFVGSNSTLVAPVEIGGGSYVAAGSVITEKVPADALALGRSRQTNKEGWARRRREK